MQTSLEMMTVLSKSQRGKKEVARRFPHWLDAKAGNPCRPWIAGKVPRVELLAGAGSLSRHGAGLLDTSGWEGMSCLGMGSPREPGGVLPLAQERVAEPGTPEAGVSQRLRGLVVGLSDVT